MFDYSEGTTYTYLVTSLTPASTSNRLPSGGNLGFAGNSYWAFGPKVGLRPTKDCIEEGEGNAPPPQKNDFLAWAGIYSRNFNAD